MEKQERRKAILEAAKTVFAEKGYDAAILDEIASKVGYAKGTLYLYFSSKEELFLTLMETEIGKLIDIIRNVSQRPSRPLEKVSTLVKKVLNHFEANREFFRIFTPERGGLTEKHHPKLRKRILPKYKEALSLTSQLIKEGMDKGEIRKSDPLTLAHALTGLVNAMITRWLLEDCRRSLRKYSKIVVAVFFDGVRAPLEPEEKELYVRRTKQLTFRHKTKDPTEGAL